jgi:polysaccharide deacetylase family protein (PEP-CTERM system associated)
MNILTIDLEDWFHILDFPGTESVTGWDNMESRVEKNSERILDLLIEKNQRATWFCLGWIVKKYPSLIKRIAETQELGYHSDEHLLLYKSNPVDVRNDINYNIRLLEDISGKKISSYRAPGFSFTPETKWIVSVLSECGIKYDCSIFPAKRNHGGYKSLPVSLPCLISYNGSVVKELPMSKTNFAGRNLVFSGGGYFRLLPYDVISYFMKRSDYVMTYFHPRDFDPDQPMIKGLPLKRKFMSYVGLKKSFSKLNRLLNDYKFVSVEEAAKQIDWATAPIINLENY